MAGRAALGDTSQLAPFAEAPDLICERCWRPWNPLTVSLSALVFRIYPGECKPLTCWLGLGKLPGFLSFLFLPWILYVNKDAICFKKIR